MTEPNRERLGQAIEARRKTMGLSLSAAARLAGIDRATWTGSERGTRQTEAYNFAGIERALRWAPGSVERTLAGGAPTELPAAPVVDIVRPPMKIDLDYELDRVRALDIPPRTKLRLIQALIELAGQAQEAESGAPNATR